MRRSQTPLQFLVAPHQFEEAERIPDGMDAADFVRINGRDRHRFDVAPFAAGDNQHLGFVVETILMLLERLLFGLVDSAQFVQVLQVRQVDTREVFDRSGNTAFECGIFGRVLSQVRLVFYRKVIDS